ncbi:MAG: GDSL-type esterase/lipase family protein [Stecheria intestinalis]|nr:GDSL-type esterase/lipase family protein [Anaerolactibacter massiliensis]MDD7680020.1 GDSL-type esterase/lipase family protein [Stecheria intestinalis]MDY4681204.1 GDSL-type esterase/lipase family protein [Lachnospiraceae bacterium]
MKPIEFHAHGKKYQLKPAGLIILILAILIAVFLVLISVRNFKHRNARETALPSASAVPSSDASAEIIQEGEFDGTLLPETEDAGKDYVDSTLFLGDSNTARFLKVTDSEGNTFTKLNNTIGVVGMGIDAISTLPCMDFSTGRYTMPQSVKILQPERVIITFGTNNLSGTSTDASDFITRYTAQIEAVESAYPSADIIINSIPPIGRVNQYPNVSMKQIDAYNKAIAEMCQKYGWKFLNSSETLKDASTGYARDGYTVSDGLHLSSEGLEALFFYIRTHAWITEDDRPKPLASIPTVIGVPDGLIQINPLNEETFTEDPASDWTPAPEQTEQPVSVPETSAPAPTPTPTPVETPAPATVPTPDCSNAGTYDSSTGSCVCNPGYHVENQTSCVIDPTPVPSAVPESTAVPDTAAQVQTEGTGTEPETGNTEN